MTARLTVLAALLLTLIASTTTSAASSSPEMPTLGLKQTSVVYGDSPNPSLLLISQASHPTRVSLTPGEGWTLTETEVTLAPDEEMRLPFTTVGPTSSLVSKQTLLDPVTGGTQGSLELQTRLLSERPAPPMDWTPWAMTLALVLLLLLATVLALRWVRTHVQVNIR